MVSIGCNEIGLISDCEVDLLVRGTLNAATRNLQVRMYKAEEVHGARGIARG
jgi:hypothetical protein